MLSKRTCLVPGWSISSVVLLLVFVSLVFVLSASAQSGIAGSKTGNGAPIQHIEALGNGTVALDGKWQFHLGDDMAWVRPEFDDSGWEQITADKPWGAQGHPGYTGFAWYRLHISVEPVKGAPPDLAMFIPTVDDVWELYWNGQLVGHFGKLPPHPDWVARNDYDPFAPQTLGLGAAHRGVLAMRVWKAPLSFTESDQAGGFESIPVLGTPEGIKDRKASEDYSWLRGNQLYFGEVFFYLLVGLLCLGAWLRDRRQMLLFWMAGHALAELMWAVSIELRIPWPPLVMMIVDIIGTALFDISLWFLLVLLLGLDGNHRLVRAVKLCAWVNTVANGLGIVTSLLWVSPVPFRMVKIADGILVLITFLLKVLPLLLVLFAISRRQRLGAARWLVAIFAFAHGTLIWATYISIYLLPFTHWTLLSRIAGELFNLNGSSVGSILLLAALLQMAIVYAVACYTLDYHRQQTAIAQEMEQARQVQQVLIPEAQPRIPGFEIHSEYRPAQQVGGDFFQILPSADGGVLAVIGDVSGKGMPAAMMVSLLVGAFRTEAQHTESPAQLLAMLNTRTLGRSQGGFTTCLIVRVDVAGRGTAANAGHLPPYLNGREIPVVNDLPLGLNAASAYTETEFRLEAGNQLTLLTDGIAEARSKSGELFGFERTASVSVLSASDAASRAQQFGQQDDITVVTLMRKAAQEAFAVHAGRAEPLTSTA
jgi:hypothetical protein